MEFGKLSLIFDRDCELTDFLSMLLEGDDDDRLECRRVLDSCIDRLKELNPELMLETDENIGALINEYSGIFFTAGYIVGQAFDVTDPEAQKEIEFLRKKLESIIQIWPRKKAPDHPTKEDSEASSRQ
ncbi:MAG: hypothetical protein ABSB22_04510 [Thermodesulfobacteriota bacterium]|jgi:hypothetical protein